MGRVGGEQEEGMMLQREVLCFSGQKQRLSARHNLKIHNGDRNPVVKRWLLTHCAGAKALLQLLIKKKNGRFDLQPSPTSCSNYQT